MSPRARLPLTESGRENRIRGIENRLKEAMAGVDKIPCTPDVPEKSLNQEIPIQNVHEQTHETWKTARRKCPRTPAISPVPKSKGCHGTGG